MWGVVDTLAGFLIFGSLALAIIFVFISKKEFGKGNLVEMKRSFKRAGLSLLGILAGFVIVVLFHKVEPAPPTVALKDDPIFKTYYQTVYAGLVVCGDAATKAEEALSNSSQLKAYDSLLTYSGQCRQGEGMIFSAKPPEIKNADLRNKFNTNQRDCAFGAADQAIAIKKIADVVDEGFKPSLVVEARDKHAAAQQRLTVCTATFFKLLADQDIDMKTVDATR